MSGPRDPHSILGIRADATVAQARAAYRRLALRHHPDRNPGDPEAHRRFQRILRAYRGVLAAAVTRAGAAPSRPAGPRPDRYGCGSCGDGFPFPERCPRCDVPLWDRCRGPARACDDPRIAQLEARLLRRSESTGSAGPTLQERLPVPGLLVSGCFAAAVFSWQVGPLGPALLFMGFALYVVGLETHRRVATGG